MEYKLNDFSTIALSIREQMITEFKTSGDRADELRLLKEFKASKGWALKFKKRFNF
jgi:hypothetical protein